MGGAEALTRSWNLLASTLRLYIVSRLEITRAPSDNEKQTEKAALLRIGRP